MLYFTTRYKTYALMIFLINFVTPDTTDIPLSLAILPLRETDRIDNNLK